MPNAIDPDRSQQARSDNAVLKAEHERMRGLLVQLLDHWDDGCEFVFIMSHTYAPRIRELLREVKAR